MIIATCQHEISLNWLNIGKGEIAVKEKDCMGEDCITYLVVCPKCLKWYQKENLIIKKQ